MDEKQKTFFPTYIHSVTLALPLIALLATLIYLALYGPGDFNYDGITSRFILNVLLMNGLHLGFPFVLLAALPAGRELVQSKFKTYGPWKCYLVILLSFFGFYSLSIASLMEQSPLVQKIASQILIWFFLVLPTIHGIRQSLGISLLLTRASTSARSLTPPELSRIAKITGLEHRLTTSLCICIIFAWSVNTLQELEPAYIVAAEWIKLAAAICALAIATTLFFIIWREPLFKSTGKALFIVRLMLSPFGLYCQLAIWLLSAIHTQEYLALLSKILSSTKTSKLKVQLILGLILSVGLLLPMFSIEIFVRWSEGKYILPTENSIWNYGLLAILPSITLLHYVVDGLIYRMRDPDVRRTLGALILTR